MFFFKSPRKRQPDTLVSLSIGPSGSNSKYLLHEVRSNICLLETASRLMNCVWEIIGTLWVAPLGLSPKKLRYVDGEWIMVLSRRPGSLNINLTSVTDVVTPLERTEEKCICGVSNMTKHRNMDTPSCCINRQRRGVTHTHTRKIHTATFTWSPSLLLSQVQVEHIQSSCRQFGWVSLSSMKRIRAEPVCVCVCVCVDVRTYCCCWSGWRGGVWGAVPQFQAPSAPSRHASCVSRAELNCCELQLLCWLN